MQQGELEGGRLEPYQLTAPQECGKDVTDRSESGPGPQSCAQ